MREPSAVAIDQPKQRLPLIFQGQQAILDHVERLGPMLKKKH